MIRLEPFANDRLRVLFMVEAITLAHASRMSVLAKSLDPARYEVQMACDSRFNHVIQMDPSKLRPLPCISTEHFLGQVAHGKVIWDLETLKGYVEEDLRRIRDFKPDVIVGDFRLSLAVSARITETPYVNLTNAYWSPFGDFRLPVPDVPAVRVFGPRFSEGVFNVFDQMLLKPHAEAINRLISDYKLRLPEFNIWDFYTNGDWTLYADLPGMVPTKNLPENHRFIGPIIWNPKVCKPVWWEMVPKDRPVAYVTMGSSGDGTLLPKICEALYGLGMTTLVATAGNSFIQTNVQENRFVANFLAGEDIASFADIVVCNGGSPTSYQALSKGTPVLGFPSNFDQYLNMSLLEQSGGGRLLRSENLQIQNIQQAVKELLTLPKFKKSAEALRTRMALINATEEFQRLISQIAA